MRTLLHTLIALLALCCAKAQAQSWTFQESNTALDSASVALTVDAGDLVVLWYKYEDAPGTPAVSDGTQAMTVRGVNTHTTQTLSGFFAYYVANTGGAKTFTVSGAGSTSFARSIVMEFSCSNTPEFDTDRSDGDGTSTAITSGNITTTGSAELVIASYGEFSDAAFSNPLINGAAPDATLNADAARVWYETNAGAFTGDADATLNSSQAWISSIIGFKCTSGGGGGSSIAAKAMHYRKMTGAQ